MFQLSIVFATSPAELSVIASPLPVASKWHNCQSYQLELESCFIVPLSYPLIKAGGQSFKIITEVKGSN